MAGTTTSIILSGADHVDAMSSDGRYVAYDSVNGNDDTLYVLDLNTLVSTPIDSFTAGTGSFTDVILSANNDFLFYSEGEYGPPVAGTSGVLLVKDLTSSAPPVNVTPALPPAGTVYGLHYTFVAEGISNDGNTIVYDEEYVDPGYDPETFFGIVVENRTTGAMEAFDSAEIAYQVNEDYYSDIGLSGDGRYLTFGYLGDYYILDMQSNTQQVIPAGGVALVSVPGAHLGIAIASADNRYVSHDGVSGDQTQVYVHDNDAPAYAQDNIVSTSADGVVANNSAYQMAFSGNGEFVIFRSDATNLVPGVTDGDNVYIKDVKTGAIRVIDGVGENVFISYDGSRIISQNSNGITITTVNEPTLTINEINGDDYVNSRNGSTITVSGTSDAIGKTIALSLPGGFLHTTTALVQDDGTWSTTLSTSSFGDGAINLHASVVDDFGNSTTADHPFIIDRTPPTDVAITSVAGDNIINAAEISHTTITGTVQVADPTGAGTDSGSLKISIDGGGSKTFVTQPSGSLVDASFSQVFNASGVADGEHIITLTATDPAGNTTTLTKQVLVDTTPPKIAITSISGDDVINPTELKTAQAIQGTSDAIGETVTVSLNGNAVGQAVVQADGTWLATGNFGAANPGENLVTADVEDEAGNPGEAAAGVYVDRGFSVQDLSVGPAGQEGGGSGVMFPELDAAGDKLIFTGVNFNLMSTATGSSGAQVYIKNLTTGAITFATPDPSENSEFGAISPDGTKIEFVSNAQLDLATQQSIPDPNGYYAYEESLSDGVPHFRAFDSQNPDALNFQLPNGKTPAEPFQVFPLSIANNGYDTVVNLTTNGSGSVVQVFENIVVDGSTTSGGQPTSPYNELETLSPSPFPDIGTYQAYDAQFSADGSVVAMEVNLHAEQSTTTPRGTNFEIYAGSTNSSSFGHIALASSDSSGNALPYGAVDPALSGNGQFVAFWSWDSSGNLEVYRKNLTTGELDVVSSDANGNAGIGNSSGTFTGGFNTIAISADGRYVAFTSDAVLTSDDSGTGADLFIKDMQTGAITRANLPTGTFANDLSTQLTMNAAGSYLAFVTSGALVFGDNNTVNDVYGFSVAALGPPPQITINPVTGNDRIDAAEVSSHVVVSGTSDAIGGTVTLYVDGGALSGVTVGSGGTWSTTFDATNLTNGVHQLRATVTTSGGATNTVGDLITVDTVAPTLTLSADNAHLAPGQTTTVTVHFSEGIGNVTGSFLSATGGTLGSPVFVDDHTLTELFTPTSGATAYSVAANSGAYFDLSGNAGISGATLVLGVPVVSGQTAIVSSGQTGSGQTVVSGGNLVVSSGGSGVSPVVSSGGSETVSSGGTTIDTLVSSGGGLTVSSGGFADPTTIYSGGSEIVSGGGSDFGAVISGGTQLVYGTASGVTIFTGSQVIESGGSGGALLMQGGSELVSSGGVISASGAAITLTGSSFVGAVNNAGIISAGNFTGIAVENISTFSGTLVNGGTIAAAVGIEIGSGVSGFGAAIFNSGVISAATGVAVTGSIIHGPIRDRGTIAATSHGILIGSGGGITSAVDAIALFGEPSFTGGIENDGILSALSSGIWVSSTTVFSGGILNAGMIAAKTNAITLFKASVFAGGVSNAGVISSLSSSGIWVGQVSTFTGGIVNSGTIAGGREAVAVVSGTSFGGGIFNAAGATLSGNSNAIIVAHVATFGGGITNVGTVSAGPSAILIDAVSSFGGGITNVGTIVGQAGIVIDNANFVSGAIVNSGSIFASGGQAILLEGSGAVAVVVAGGSITGAILGNGINDTLDFSLGAGGSFGYASEISGFATNALETGTLALASGGVIEGNLTFSGGTAALELDAGTAQIAGNIVGMAAAGGRDFIDLRFQSFASGDTVSWTQSGTSGTLSLLTSGGATLDTLTLVGNYLSNQFTVASDGIGGTLIGASFVVSGGNSPYSVVSGQADIGDIVISSGSMSVLSGANASATTIAVSGTEIVSVGGFDFGAQISGGRQVDFGLTSAATIFAGGVQIVRAGGVASRSVVSSGGVFSDLGAASGTLVGSAGTDFVQSGGTETGAGVSGGGTEFIEAHGQSIALALAGGAVLTNFGSASGTIVGSGASDFIQAGGVETGGTLSGGGTEFIEAGGIGNGLTLLSGGVFANFGSASGTIVSSGGTDNVEAAGTETGGTLSGGVELIQAGGTTKNLTVSSGGIVANYGGSASGTIVGSSALDYVEANGIEAGATLFSGGIEYIEPGGIAENLTVSSGGIVANYGGSASGTIVRNGGLDFTESGGVETGATLSNGGIEYIESGGKTIGLTVSSGGIAANYGGSASGTITLSGGLDYVEAEAVETGGMLSSGGIGYVFASGTINALTVSSGGIVANYGGSASGTMVSNGGSDFVEAGGVETGATIANGGIEYVEIGGKTGNLTVSSGGNLIDYGSGSGTIIRNGGTEYIEPGAVETGGAVSSGGVEYIYNGGTALGLTVSSGGNIADHGSASGTIVSNGGTDFVVVGGNETGATLLSGGVEFIEVGGTALGLTVSSLGIVANYAGSASGTRVSSGGQDYLEAGAVETGAILFKGGAEFIEAGGTASGVTISGGLVDLTSGGVISGAVTFVNSGQLTLADSQDFNGLVAGFSNSTTKLDLQDITFVSGATTVSWTQLVSGSNGSGTLTVSGGGHAANITLIGQYATGNFTISADGAGGTLVTDPPLTPTDSAIVLVNQHH